MDKIKIWAFPLLSALVGWFVVDTLSQIRDDIQSLKADVKVLLTQSNIDKTRIDNLEREVYGSPADEDKLTAQNTKDQPENSEKKLLLITYMFFPVKQEELDDIA